MFLMDICLAVPSVLSRVLSALPTSDLHVRHQLEVPSQAQTLASTRAQADPVPTDSKD